MTMMLWRYGAWLGAFVVPLVVLGVPADLAHAADDSRAFAENANDRFDFSEDFSSVQGKRHWFYLYWNAAQNRAVPMTWDGSLRTSSSTGGGYGRAAMSNGCRRAARPATSQPRQ
jgi:hypothetical protein